VKDTNRPALLRYGVALATIIAAMAILVVGGTERGLGAIVLFAVMFSAWYGGLGPGLLATTVVVAARLATIRIPADQPLGSKLLGLGLFALGGVLISTLLEALHAARRRAEFSSDEAKRHQATLRGSESRLQAILENTPAVVYLKGLDGRYSLVNRRFRTLFRLRESQVLGKTANEIFSEELALSSERNDEEVLLARRALEFEERFPLGDGVHTFLTVKFPLVEDNGAPYALCGMATDITDRKQAEESLRNADRNKDEFLAILGHELRNPLAAISGAARLMREPHEPDDVEWIREIIERQSAHLARLLDDLLDVSRISKGKIELRKELLDLQPVLERAVASVQPILRDLRHDLGVSIGSEPLPLFADPTRLEQVIVNLLNNAAKYTEPGGRIVLSATRQGRDVVIAVKDTGVGIAPEMLPRVFDMFEQAAHSINRSQGGLGLGLTLVRSLVEMHGGSVSATSAGIGLGSEFIVHLPVAAPVPARDSSRSLDATARPQRALRILLVDDNHDMARALGRFLSRHGYDVLTASDGAQALETARMQLPEVVLLDIGLPGLDGYEVAELLRREPGCAEALIIAISGYGQEQDLARSRAAGFDAHLVKPIDYEELLALLSQRPAPQHGLARQLNEQT
jgi:PAS domain S-box-containing protein